MSNFVVAVPLDPSLAEFIGKKGSVNSITFYNRKFNEHVIVALAPTEISEKFYAVAEAMMVARQIVLSTANVDRLFGEMLVACSLLGKRIIATDENNVDAMAAELGIKGIEYAGREKLIEMLANFSENPRENLRIDIDKSFNVKGVGAVALGIVGRGTVKVHDKLYHSSGKEVTIRSIQSQDVDIDDAGPGTRVGLALKGAESDEIEKGDVLATSPVKRVSRLSAAITASKYAKEEIAEGKTYGLVHNFSYANATVTAVGERITLSLEKDIAIEAGDEFLLMRGAAPRIFAKGTVTSEG